MTNLSLKFSPELLRLTYCSWLTAVNIQSVKLQFASLKNTATGKNVSFFLSVRPILSLI